MSASRSIAYERIGILNVGFVPTADNREATPRRQRTASNLTLRERAERKVCLWPTK
jgi:hypothetical protein